MPKKSFTPSPKPEKIDSIWYFMRFMLPYWPSALLVLFLLIASSAASIYEPLALKNIIDWLTNQGGPRTLTTLVVLYFAVKLAGLLFDMFRDYVWSPIIYSISRDIEQRVYKHLLELPISYHADQKSGAAVRAVVRGTNAVSLILDFTVTRLIPPFFQLIFVSAILFRLYTWQYSVITFVSIVAYTFFIIWSNEKRIKYRIEGNSKDDAASGVLVDSVTNIETVKYFNSGLSLFTNWQDIKREWIRLLTRNNRIFAASFAAQNAILLLGLGLILVLAIDQARVGLITIGSLILVSTYIIQLSGPISILGFVYGQYKNSFADLNAMAKILNEAVTIPEPTNPVAIKELKGDVVFDHVTFAYENRDAVITDLNLHVKAGEKVAFVGPSGAGKSTIAKLIFRLYDVKSGEIKLDGVNLSDLSAESRKDLLAIVPQEPALFNDTLLNNILFSKPDATMKEVIAAAKDAQIHDFIETLPDKYETKVGERGMKISGGQKQRVAIARAILKDPKILIFDEATSSLDSKSEQAILKTLESVAKGRTTIAIAHRLSTIVNSDRIYVLQKGKIVESGKHNELLAKKGVYEGMWRLQAQAREVVVDESTPEPVDA